MSCTYKHQDQVSIAIVRAETNKSDKEPLEHLQIPESAPYSVLDRQSSSPTWQIRLAKACTGERGGSAALIYGFHIGLRRELLKELGKQGCCSQHRKPWSRITLLEQLAPRAHVYSSSLT